ncbi:MAG: class I SAM-dependent methyltransferase [Rubrivivax sp.]|jgi:SAM-dependent methyltransferase|nr:class I SAM-dependent methyltransferase [Rubrivivax sp.]
MTTPLPTTHRDPQPVSSVLRVGCGMQHLTNRRPPFNQGAWREVRLDIDPDVAPDLMGSITDMRAVQDGSFDVVYSSHNIEHLYAHEVPLALREMRRVLRDDGLALITCPDLKAVAALIAQDRLDDVAYHSPAGPISPLDIVYGHRPSLAAGNLYMAHRFGFTETTLRKALLDSGFATVAAISRPAALDLWALGFKTPRTQAQAMEAARRFLPVG